MKTINIPYEEYLELKRLAEATNVEELEKIIEQQKSEIKTVGDLLESVTPEEIELEGQLNELFEKPEFIELWDKANKEAHEMLLAPFGPRLRRINPSHNTNLPDKEIEP